MARLTIIQVKRALAAVGVSIRRNAATREFRVNLARGDESTAYYTENLEDALGTGLAMARTFRPHGFRRELCRDCAGSGWRLVLWDSLAFREARAAKGISLNSAARKVGISPAYLSNIERGLVQVEGAVAQSLHALLLD